MVDDWRSPTDLSSFCRDIGVPITVIELRACPREHREVVLHAIWLISMKLCQFKECSPKLKKTNWFLFWFLPSWDTSRKFLILLLPYFPLFWLQISSAFAIIFADCHGLSWVHVRASSYTALFRVSLGRVGLRCVGLAQKISARCNTGSYVFSFFFICIFILFLALLHIYIFSFPQRVPSDF